MRFTFSIICLLFLISAKISPSPIDTNLVHTNGDSSAIIEGKISLLAGLMYQRLSLSADVAAWKFINEAPVEDKRREEEIINYQVLSAIQMKIDTNLTKTFYQNQIRASKLLQNYYINILFKDSAVSEVNDLEYVTRPAINHISNHLLLVLSDTKDYLSSAEWKNYFKNEIKNRIETLAISNIRLKELLISLLTDF